MNIFNRFTYAYLMCISTFGLIVGGRVLELSDRFLEVKHDGTWLIKFYAPWCGHCKQLEPVWDQVAQVLVNTDIRVGRVDCTRFTGVATEFSIRGFPTILFVKGSRRIEYRGDRTKEDISEFARRLDGPVVQTLKDCEELESLKKSKPSFFLFLEANSKDITEEDNKLRDEFYEAAQNYQQHHYFYIAPVRCLFTTDEDKARGKSSVVIYKDRATFSFENTTEALQDRSNLTLTSWINEERFPSFLKITNGNFYQLMKTGKYIAIAILEENPIHKLSLKMQELYDVLEAIALNNRDLYHRHFVFGWLPLPDIANSVAMSNLAVPSIIVINSETYQYYLPDIPPEQNVPASQDIIQLLDKIVDKSATAYGGDTFPYRIYRTYYEATSALSGMWKGNPVLTCVLFGLPLGFLSIICYTSCCNDILEASEEDETTEDEQARRHEKKD